MQYLPSGRFTGREINGLKKSWQFPYLGVGNFCSAFDQVVKPVSLFDLGGGKHLQHPRHSFRSHTCLISGLHIGPDLAVVAAAQKGLP